LKQWLAAAGFAASLALAGVALNTTSIAEEELPAEPKAAVAPAALGSPSSEVAARHGGSQHAIKIRKPSGPPRVATGLHDLAGNPVTVACSTCHSTREPNSSNKTAGDLDEFHSKLTFSHGAVSCLSCHNPDEYDSLKLADGARVEFTEVMTLCAQCHGPQMEAYKHGAHGGMTGHWDLTRGPRQRNNCVDCHHPHSPQLPKMHPTFKPHDRFLQSPRPEH